MSCEGGGYYLTYYLLVTKIRKGVTTVSSEVTFRAPAVFLLVKMIKVGIFYWSKIVGQRLSSTGIVTPQGKVIVNGIDKWVFPLENKHDGRRFWRGFAARLFSATGRLTIVFCCARYFTE